MTQGALGVVSRHSGPADRGEDSHGQQYPRTAVPCRGSYRGGEAGHGRLRRRRGAGQQCCPDRPALAALAPACGSDAQRGCGQADHDQPGGRRGCRTATMTRPHRVRSRAGDQAPRRGCCEPPAGEAAYQGPLISSVAPTGLNRSWPRWQLWQRVASPDGAQAFLPGARLRRRSGVCLG